MLARLSFVLGMGFLQDAMEFLVVMQNHLNKFGCMICLSVILYFLILQKGVFVDWTTGLVSIGNQFNAILDVEVQRHPCR